MMRSIEETRALPKIDPELDQLLKNGYEFPFGMTFETDVYGIRAFMKEHGEAQRLHGPDPSGLPYIEGDRRIPMRDGVLREIRVTRPRNPPAGGSPGMLMLHGGGFIMGDLNTGAGLSRAFAKLGGVSVTVDYRLAPESPFPVGIHDSYDALEWLAQNYKELDINAEKGFLVAGESAGADLALTISHLWSEKKSEPALTGIYASMTSGVNKQTVPERYRDHFISLEQNADAPMMTSESLDFTNSLYKPDPTSPLAYPVAFGDHSILPKTYFVACGWDIFRDCTLVMEQVWRDAGVPTRLDIYAGLPHAFYTRDLPIEATKRYWSNVDDGLRWLLA